MEQEEQNEHYTTKMNDNHLVWHTVQKPVEALKDYAFNPRKITEVQLKVLAESLTKFNYVAPVVVNADHTIIAGHQRIRALKLLGREKEVIEVRMPSRLLSDEEVKELNVIDNKVGGDFDFEILSNNFDADFLQYIGFTDVELSGISNDASDGGSKEDKETSEKKEKKPTLHQVTCPHCEQSFQVEI